MASRDGHRSNVEILLSTYNGAPFIRELLDSVLAQSFRDWRLVARDDGSRDDTLAILKEYSKAHPGKIEIIKDTHKRLGPCQSFAVLLSKSKSDYVMFCDQDDIWLPEKIELTLKAMKGLEEKYEGIPLLVHTDMKVTDKDLKVLSKSFWKYQHINPAMKALNNLLVFNNVSGCTMMINGRLRELSQPIPKAAILHDWWIAIVASAFGRTEYVRKPTLLYRQHGANDAGAMKYSLKYFAGRLKNLKRSATLLKRIVGQSGAFVVKYSDMLSDDKLELANSFSTLLNKKRSERVKTLLKFNLKGYGRLRNLGILSLWLMIKQQGGQ